MNGKRTVAEGNPGKIKVLMYHRVVDSIGLSEESPAMCIHIDQFRRHLALLDRWGFTPITFNDYRLFLAGEINLPKRPIVLTFDDGYEDNFENAFPALQDFGMKAVFFVLGDRGMKANTWDKDSSMTLGPLMSEGQILELHRAGFEIGSHSLTHPGLSHLTREEAWDEISRSRQLLEILLNSPVNTFAFPYGLANATTKKMVTDAGYTLGCATYSGPAVFGRDCFEIRRTLIFGDTDALGLALRVLTPYEYYSWARWKVKMILTGFRRPPDAIDHPELAVE
jgi:peptidoglycan/xylan/chitin deacetylase (PgdA/CDA1 family)